MVISMTKHEENWIRQQAYRTGQRDARAMKDRNLNFGDGILEKHEMCVQGDYDSGWFSVGPELFNRALS